MTGGDAQGGRDLFDIQFQHLGQFFGRRLALEFLLQLGIRFLYPVGKTDLVERETNDTGLFCQRLQDALADPPYGIRNELKAARFIETLCSFDQSQVSFIDEIR
jgi:hypothetical protein